ncbi:MAG: hypothetical protein XU15_C0003G0092 [candidate division NC10 bacterium CSP1-5]|nr:MAG: hypothetical protein XU15_C0003G0092 [candidate division NC10 bacterium CSP1-5]
MRPLFMSCITISMLLGAVPAAWAQTPQALPPLEPPVFASSAFGLFSEVLRAGQYVPAETLMPHRKKTVLTRDS